MKITEFLRGLGAPNGKPENPTKLSSAITDLERERGLAQAKLAGANEERMRLLLNDDDAAIDTLDREIEAAHRTIEKIDLAMPALRERLLIAQDRLRESKIAEHRKAAAAAFEKLDAALQQAHFINQAAVHAFEAAIADLGENGARLLVTNVVCPVLNSAMIDQWRNYVQDSLYPMRPSVVRPAMVTSKRPDRISKSEKNLGLVTSKPAPRDPVVIAGSPGDVEIVILRDGYSAPGGQQCRRGDRVSVHAEIAKKAVGNGAADYSRPQDAPL